jgi:hypothetical protein
VQYLINEMRIHKEEEEKRKRAENAIPQPTISITRVAGHMGSEGNEAADELAKEAAGIWIQRTPKLSSHHLTHRRKNKTKQSKMVETPEEMRINQDHRPKSPSSKLHKGTRTRDRNRRQTSVLTQLRIGHTTLNQHLHRIQRNLSPEGPHCPYVNEGANNLAGNTQTTTPAYTSARTQCQLNTTSTV